MSYTDWKDKTSDFKKIDVRGIQGNFFQGIKKHAINTEVGNGLEIVQSFDPIPLYDVMDGLGFEHHTEQVNENEFHAYFYRTESKEDNGDIPMRPAALTNMPLIDKELGKVAVQFWDLTWNDRKRHLPYEIRLLLSLTNAVGAGRMRQATRELVKAYIHGLDSAALDDVFELFAWNQGIGYFSSEIGPSTLFAAYKTIKNTKAPFMKKYIQGITDNKGTDGNVRFRALPLLYGNQQVLISKEWYERQRELFIDWYSALSID